MEFDYKKWIEELSFKIKEHFKERVLFIGLQGSYKRGEANKDSDIDLVLILDSAGIEDLREYKKILRTMPHKEKACGFVSGKDEITNWSKTDLFQFYYETEPIFKDLTKIIEPPSLCDIKETCKSGAQALYHAACHSFLFDNDKKESLKSLYKMSFFILQAQYFLHKQTYVPTKAILVELLDGEDKKVLKNCLNRDFFSKMSEEEIDGLYETLINWCSQKISDFAEKAGSAESPTA